MANSSNVQTDFQGGIWSEMAQGQMDDPTYKTGMNESLNGYPTEEKAWVRRPGFRSGDFTRNGARGRLKAVSVFAKNDYDIELTNGHLRFWHDQRLVTEAAWTVSAISGAKPAVVTVTATEAWATGDQVIFELETAGANPDAVGLLENRCFAITVIDTTHFSISDPVTGLPFDGSLVTLGSNVVFVSRVVDLASPYATEDIWSKVNIAGKSGIVYLFHPDTPLQSLTTSNGSDWALAPFVYSDGPYLDPAPISAPPLTPDHVGPNNIKLTFNITAWDTANTYDAGFMVLSSGIPYLSLVQSNKGNTPASSPTKWQVVLRSHYFNDGAGLQATDVGRLIRLLSSPPTWDLTVTYNPGDIVGYLGVGWHATATSTNSKPGTVVADWIVGTGATSQWRWGSITSLGDDGVTYDFSVNIHPPYTFELGEQLLTHVPGYPLLYAADIFEWRLGLYNTTNGPSSGGFHEGRLWTASYVPNRTDASVAGNTNSFAPSRMSTEVTEEMALDEVFDSPTKSKLLWFQSTSQGLLVGADTGEWKIEATEQNNPITPEDVQSHNESAFGSADIQPQVAGVVPLFVHRNGQLIYESLRDTYSGQMIALSMSDKAKHLTAKGILDIAYTRGSSPIIWALVADGTLVGSTYRRDKLRMFTIEPPQFNGWHRHSHGSGNRDFISIAPYKSIHNDGDSLAVITEEHASGRCRVEFLSDQMLQTDDIYFCNFLDGLAPVTGALLGTEGETVVVPDTPGFWSAPGYHITQQCDVFFGNDLTTIALSGEEDGFASAAAATAIMGALTKIPIPDLTTHNIWISPPAGGGGGGCGGLGFTNNGSWAGEIGASIGPPDFPTGFVIWQCDGDTSFHTTGWLPYQFWSRDIGSSATPVQPTWTAPVIGGTTIVGVGTATGASLHGLSQLEATNVTAFIAGVDCGEFPVIGGKIEVPFGCVPEFTYERLQHVDAMRRDWKELAVNIGGFIVPAVVGYKYDSRGQRLRPIVPADTGAQAGPGFGKKKRTHKYAILLQRSRGFSVGTSFDAMYPAILETSGGSALPSTSLYSGIHKDTLGDDSTLDSMIAWESKDCWPLNVCAIGGFIETQDE